MVREEEQRRQSAAEMEARVKRIRGNPDLCRGWPDVPEAQRWLKCFSTDAMRYAILIVYGPSFSGKTEWAKSFLKNALEVKVGHLLDYFPESMRKFQRGQT